MIPQERLTRKTYWQQNEKKLNLVITILMVKITLKKYSFGNYVPSIA